MPASSRKQQKAAAALDELPQMDEDDELDTSFVVDENDEQAQEVEDDELDAEMDNDADGDEDAAVDAVEENGEAEAAEEEEELSMEEKIARVLNKGPRDKRAFGDLVSKDDDLNYDLGNLMAFDTHAIDMDKYKQEGKKYLEEYSRQNVQLLIGHLFRLPTKQEEEGLFADLPAPTTRLPREKPVPVEKAPTLFEKFKKERNLRFREKEKLVYDKVSNEYKQRHGHKKANQIDDLAIIPAKPSDAPGTDPWIEARLKRKEDKKKNEYQQSRNLKRVEKSLPGQIAISNSASLKARDIKTSHKKNLSTAYDIARLSTASMGKFDRKLGIEPKQNELRPSRKDKKSLVGGTSAVTSQERDVSKQVLGRVLQLEAQRKHKISSQGAKVFQKVQEKTNRVEKKKKMGVLGMAKDKYKKKLQKDHDKK